MEMQTWTYKRTTKYQVAGKLEKEQMKGETQGFVLEKKTLGGRQTLQNKTIKYTHTSESNKVLDTLKKQKQMTPKQMHTTNLQVVDTQAKHNTQKYAQGQANNWQKTH